MKSWPLWTPRPSLGFHRAHVPFKIPLDRYCDIVCKHTLLLL